MSEEVIMNESNNCVLKLNHLVFDGLNFERDGFKNESTLKLNVGFDFDMTGASDFIVHLMVEGKKEDEFRFSVRASGYFTVDENAKHNLLALRQNAAAIVFPYIRSQVSLLTAQPEMKPVVLPPMNIAQMVEEATKEDADKTKAAPKYPM